MEKVTSEAEGSVLHVYLSPQHAGGISATLASWYVEDIESVVDELAARGVAAFDGGAKVAYSKDPDGNTLSVAQAPMEEG